MREQSPARSTVTLLCAGLASVILGGCGGGPDLPPVAPVSGTVTLDGKHPFHLDSRKPTLSFAEVAKNEGRFAMLMRSAPETAERLFALAQDDIDERWSLYEQFEYIERTITDEEARVEDQQS